MTDNKLSYEIVYYLLHHQNQFVSEQQIANEFKVSRTAIWKIIVQLQQQGYDIQSIRNKGYCLTNANEIISAPLLTYMAQQHRFCQQVFYEEVVDSTQIQAKKYLANQHKDFALIAESQTAGYGRFQRMWQSNPSQGIWMTVVKECHVSFEKIGQFNLFMACALHKSLSKFVDKPEKLKIKWPNDIYYDNHKVCGFLSEVSIDENHNIIIVYGVGINVLSAPIIANSKYQTGALQQFSHQIISRITVIESVFINLAQAYDDFKVYDFVTIKDYWILHSLVWHQWLTYSTANSQFRGLAQTITNEGYLIVVDEQGTPYTLMSADIDF